MEYIRCKLFDEQIEIIKIHLSLLFCKKLSILSDNDSSGVGQCINSVSDTVDKSGLVESLLVETDSTFLSQGINQTRHTITLKLNIRMSIALFTKPRTFEVEDGIIIADTVIVGKVPNSYTDINKADGELIGDIVDFRAE